MFNFTEVSKYIKQHTSTVYMTVKALLLIILLVVILRSCIKSNEEQRIYNLNSATSTASGYTKEIDDLKIKQVEKELLRDSALKCAEANSHTGILVDCLVVKDFPPKTYAGEAASAAQTKTMATETMLTEAQTGTTSSGVTTPGNSGAVMLQQTKRLLSPGELFYTTALFDKCHVAQTEEQHYLQANGGVLATDISCRFGGPSAQRATVYAPDFINEVYNYTVIKVSENALLGNFIELMFLKETSEGLLQYKWVIAHLETKLKTGDAVTTGQIIGQMNLSGKTTGYHSHVELWLMVGNKWINQSTTTRSVAVSNKRVGLLDNTVKVGDTIYFTHYAVGDTLQNDSSPCQAAGGEVCNLQKSGVNVIALTADIRNLYGIKLGDMVQLNGPCSGTYKVMDEKAERYRYSCIRSSSGFCNKGDISIGVAVSGRQSRATPITYEYLALPNCLGGDHTITKL